eukprot:568759-Pleurochrysis_carterae.AAC.2
MKSFVTCNEAWGEKEDGKEIGGEREMGESGRGSGGVRGGGSERGSGRARESRERENGERERERAGSFGDVLLLFASTRSLLSSSRVFVAALRLR